ncbi:HNH endonuclease signature motif containing protein [Streptomyces sp. NPDC086776]|uniref:HNH endonuclease signature motif containing protein n=1 Tax=Streptomyces sp. NPDC086776 TaxID=3365756 RepID=UPI0037FC0989
MSTKSRRSTSKDWERRFFDKVDQGTEYDDCHIWLGAKDDYGYGKFRLPNGQVKGTHIVAWELANEKTVPHGWHVDHRCRIRSCCNPDHLEPVPAAENVARGESFSARNSRKTHCPKGHEYSEENTRWHSGRRECITCIRARDRERRIAQRAEKEELETGELDYSTYYYELD